MSEPRSALHRTWALLRPHVRGQRRLAAGGLAAVFGEVAMRLLEPWPVKVVVDLVVPADAGLPVRSDVGRVIVVAALAVLVVAALRALASYLSTVAFALVGARVTTALRAQLYERLLGAPVGFHDRSRTGDLVNRVVGDVARVQEAAITAGLPLLANVTTFVGMAVVLLVLDPLLGVVVLAAVPLFLLSTNRSSSRITDASRTQRKREGELAGDAGEAFAAVRMVQAYGLEGRLGHRFHRANDKGLLEGVRARRLAAGLERRTDVVIGAATALVVLLGAQRVVGGQLSTGELVVFLSYFKSAFKPMRDLAKHSGRIARAAASGERVADAFDQSAGPPDRSWARPLRRATGMIELQDVTAGHTPEAPVLHGVNLTIRPGQRVAVVGPSGAGKSTLLHLLLRLVEPTSGTLRLDGHDVLDLTRASVRANLGVVMQETVLLAGTVADNIRLGRADATDAEVEAAARAADAHDFIVVMANGYDTMVSERGSTLSGGQRQRIAVARALLRDPAIVLLDEPTTGLDATSAVAVLGGLRRLTAGRTTLLVTHDRALLAEVDRVVEVDGGRLSERTGLGRAS